MLVVFLCSQLLLLAMLNPPADLQIWENLKLYFMTMHIILVFWLGLGLILVGAAVAGQNTKHAG
jgi:hypothetical protein